MERHSRVKKILKATHIESMTTAFNINIGTEMLHPLSVLLQEFQAAGVYP